MPGAQTAPSQNAATTATTPTVTRPGAVRVTPQVAAQLRGMEELLRQPVAAVRGELVPIAEAQALRPTLAVQSGLQLQAPSGRYLNLVLRVTADGRSELLSATELAGAAELGSEPIGDYLYEVRAGARTLAVEALADPFEAHSFGGPPGSPEGHYFERLSEATIVVKVPATGLDSALDGLSVELHKLRAGSALERVDLESVSQLRQAGRLETLVRSEPAALVPQIRQRGLRLELP